jgi:hypothetical protein
VLPLHHGVDNETEPCVHAPLLHAELESIATSTKNTRRRQILEPPCRGPSTVLGRGTDRPGQYPGLELEPPVAARPDGRLGRLLAAPLVQFTHTRVTAGSSESNKSRSPRPRVNPNWVNPACQSDSASRPSSPPSSSSSTPWVACRRACSLIIS